MCLCLHLGMSDVQKKAHTKKKLINKRTQPHRKIRRRIKRKTIIKQLILKKNTQFQRQQLFKDGFIYAKVSFSYMFALCQKRLMQI